MTDAIFIFSFSVLFSGVLILAYTALRNLNIADYYRKKYGFDRTVESKFYKKEKTLNSVEKAFQKRSAKLK